jgi:hypothetical protein
MKSGKLWRVSLPCVSEKNTAKAFAVLIFKEHGTEMAGNIPTRGSPTWPSFFAVCINVDHGKGVSLPCTSKKNTAKAGYIGALKKKREFLAANEKRETLARFFAVCF